MPTISQAVGKVVTTNKTYSWIRISRRKLTTLAYYYRNQPNFHYMKIYAIVGYSRQTTKLGRKHEIGRQIGYITLKGEKLFNLILLISCASLR